MEKHEIPTWASVDPWNLDTKTPYIIKNLGFFIILNGVFSWRNLEGSCRKS